jgi:hypothetical protein
MTMHRFASILTLLLGILTSAAALAGPLDGAGWLRDRKFAAYKPLGTFDAQDTKEKGTPLKNVHTYFRREIELPAQPVKAMLTITGDDYYKFYVNGQFVVQGPEPAYPFAHPYYRLDISRFLQKGRNCLASHAYYHGLTTRSFNSADNRSGFMLALEVTFSDGTTARHVTDGKWKCFDSPTFPSSHKFGYDTQFNENIDLRLEPIGWRLAGFDDSRWQTPLAERQDHEFIESITPPLEHWRAEPVVVKQKGQGRYFFDFGKELVGHTRIQLKGPAGHAITVWHGEELSEPETVRHKMRCNCNYEDRITLSGRDDLVEFYDYRGFRYVEILDAPVEPKVWVDVRHHPFNAEASRLTSSDKLLEQIWGLCKNGVRMGCQGIIVDCPTREKGQYTGDVYLTALSHLLLTADPTLTKKAIKDYQLSQRFDDGMLCVAPGGFRQELAEWSLLWPPMVEYYYQMTGDAALVREMVDVGAVEKLIGWFAKQEGPNGLLTDVNRKKWVLVDWPANLRDGYDYDGTKDGENAVVNAFYYQALRSAAHLMRIAGRDGKAYDAQAERLRAAFCRRLLDPKTGLFLDGPTSRHSALHANVYPLDFGMVPEEHKANIVGMLRQKRLSCGLLAASLGIEALYRVGEHELAYDLMIASKDKHSWHEMLRSGATTPMEAWAPELKWNTSWCHPWGTTPIYMTVTYLMGLQPAEPGWKAVRLAPQIPVQLDQVELRIPTVSGPITASYRKDRGYKLTVPAKVRVEQAVPKGLRVEVVREG